MFIQTEDTPNPDTMKFLPSRAVATAPTEFRSVDEAVSSPLALALFAISGVKGVFMGEDFVSVTREADRDWMVLRPAILNAIMDYYMAGGDVYGMGECVTINTDEGDVVARIRALLDQRIRPAVAQDGGDVAFERYEDGVVYLRLKGACAGCPSATATLKYGIEQMMRHFIPEVQEVRRVG